MPDTITVTTVKPPCITNINSSSKISSCTMCSLPCIIIRAINNRPINGLVTRVNIITNTTMT